MRRRAIRVAVVLASLVAWLALVGAAFAAAPTAPVYDDQGRLVDSPFVPPPPTPRLAEERAIEIALGYPKIRDWLERYPEGGLTKDASFDADRSSWTVKVWSDRPDAGQVVLARIDDSTGQVTEAWTGPQVAWKMARGYKGYFGRAVNKPWVWYTLCAVFLFGLADLRRPFSLRNLDLLVLLSFGASLWFFNRGEIFTSVPLAYPPLFYLLARMAWIGGKGRASPARPVWPVWLLLGATIFLAGFKIGLNMRSSNVIDVGYASVIGAQRIAAQREMPYGHMPTNDGPACGSADVDGEVRDHVQTNGRCEASNERGDTYGPITYLAYVPGFAFFGWNGRWDDGSGPTFGNLPAAHFTAILFDGLAILGLGLVGWRFGGARLAATLAFAWAAYPFTQYVSSSNSNDAILPVILIFGFWLVTSAPARGLAVGLASWAKFAALLLVPLWASYPSGLRRPRAILAFALGFGLASVLAFWILFLEPDPLHAARVFWDRTFGWQLGRDSPFSIWDWGAYPGYPDLGRVQTILKIALVVAALAVGVVPRRKSPIQLAALSAALLLSFELVLTHWFYLYISWFLPFVAIALFMPAAARAAVPALERDDRQVRELVGARA